ncbi:MAG: HNH endonuclease, partial [Actinomycetota bacterium]
MIDAAARGLVRRRVGDCCEYCLLAQDAVAIARFHIEHIIPRQHGGSDETSNLALACYHCNLHKGPNLASLDPVSGAA